ncbi:MAG: 50S ribosomal protein L5 [bacterium]|nr:50S ribosomal protein L5 [bacterium]
MTKSNSPSLKAKYNEVTAKELKTELKLKNINEVPKLEKVIINTGFGRSKDDKKLIETSKLTLTKISGQMPVETVAKQSIASFKLREGNVIGLKVSLRGDRMYEFVDRLINIVLPRFRDFHGVSNKAFDKAGNFSLGIEDQTVFPEINFEDAPITHGLQVVFVFNSKQPEHTKVLLEKFGMPFKKENK